MARRKNFIEVLPGGEAFVEEGLERGSLDEIQDLLKSLPGSGDAYLKIYKTKPLPQGSRPQFKGEVNEINMIEDLEVYLRNLAKENSWGSGEYLISVIPKNPKVKPPAPVRLNISYEEEKSTPDPGEALKGKIIELKDLVSTIKDLMGSPTNPGASTVEMGRALTDSFKLGMETLKGVMPAPSDDNKILSTITQLQGMGLLGGGATSTAPNQTDLILGVLKILKEMNLFEKRENPPPPDMFAQLTHLKELGIIKMASDKEDDPFSMLEKMKSLIELVKPLVGIGGGEAEKPTFGIELVRILGPHVPKMVDRIASTVDNVAEVSKLRLSRTMGGAPPYIPPKPPISLEAPMGASTESIGEVQMHPTIKEIYDAIESRDKTFYPKLNELLNIYVGPHIIPSLLDGSLSIDTFLNSLSSNLSQPFLTEPKSKIYFEEFLSSFGQLSPKVEDHPGPSGKVVGRCNKCETEYDFDDLASFEADEKRCEEQGCGGELALVPKGV